MQEEPLTVIRSDASSRKAGAFKGEAIVYYASPLTRPPRLSGSRWRAGNAADGSLRLALWVKIDENKIDNHPI
jgi:hypothetical protein